MKETSRIIVLGSLNADLVQHVQRLPRPGETLAGGALQTFPGGKGANQACAAGRMGARVSMVGQIGDDGFGRLLTASLSSAGVDVSSVGLSSETTGTAVIFVLPDGENVIVIAAGANATLTPEQVKERLQPLQPDDLLLAQLETPLDSVECALRLARKQRAVTVLDPAPARALPASLLNEVDILTPNETEALALLGKPSESIQGDEEAFAAAQSLLDCGPRTVILKLGRRGCLVMNRHIRERVPGFSVDAVDTTAAGDTFNGALACALAEGRSMRDAARFANAAAALSVKRAGAQSSIPSRAEVENFLRLAGSHGE